MRLSAEYYTLLPAGEYRENAIQLLETSRKVSAEITKLNTLLDVHVASQILIGSLVKGKTLNVQN